MFLRVACLCGFALGLSWFALPVVADEKPAAADLVIIDHRGKELKMKNWQLTHGTRQLDWLEPAPAKPTGKKSSSAPRGPLYLEFRGEHSTAYIDGILTLIPVASLRKLDYDHDKKTVLATFLGAGDKEGTVAGSLKFAGFNRLTIEGDADLGDLGFATVKFLGGDPKHGVRGVRWPTAQAVGAPKGPQAVILPRDKDQAKHVVQELVVLYKTNAGHRTLPFLMFKRTVKVDLSKIAKLRHIEAEDKKHASLDYEVTLADGAIHTLTMLDKITTDEGPAVLVGLVGRVAVGYQLFPQHTIAALTMGEEKDEKQP